MARPPARPLRLVANQTDKEGSMPNDWQGPTYKQRKGMKDPDLESVTDMLSADKRKFNEIAKRAGVSDTTLRNWASGKTRHPQNITLTFAARAMGFKRGPWTRIK